MDAVEVELHIDADPQTVWDHAMDADATPDWVTIVEGVEEADDGPLVPGYRMSQRMRLRGVPFTVAWELVEMDAPRYARWEGRGPARSKAVIEDHLEPEGRGTRFRYRNEFHTPFGVLGSVASRALTGGVPRREACASLQQLKRIVEGAYRARPVPQAA
jgi:uncharacterized protein YndB with AHSA1/START domain